MTESKRLAALMEKYGHDAVLEITEAVLDHCMEFRAYIVRSHVVYDDGEQGTRWLVHHRARHGHRALEVRPKGHPDRLNAAGHAGTSPIGPTGQRKK
jgi:hypothetical protein